MGRKQRKNKRKPTMTYEEICNQVMDSDVLTIYYRGGLRRSGHWYEDHMLRMFSECKLYWEGQHRYSVAEWPAPRAQ